MIPQAQLFVKSDRFGDYPHVAWNLKAPLGSGTDQRGTEGVRRICFWRKMPRHWATLRHSGRPRELSTICECTTRIVDNSGVPIDSQHLDRAKRIWYSIPDF